MGRNMIGIHDERLVTMLNSAMGEGIASFLQDEAVIEIMLNPDGALWIDKLGLGRSFTGQRMTPADAERVIFTVASSVKAVCSKDSPILSAELPLSGARFQGMLPPLVTSPTFSIRKKAIKIFDLPAYVTQGIMTGLQKERIELAVKEKKNILIVGGTGSGKTTLANAVLAEIAKTGDRIVIIEDTIELQCKAQDHVALRTKDGLATMTDLLRATMRLRPDRIVIGEVKPPPF